MELFVEILFYTFIYVFYQAILEVFVSLGYSKTAGSLRKHKKANEKLALIGCAVFGCFLGFLSYIIYPERIIENPYMPGISLLISPILVGIIMKIWGEKRLEAGKDITILGTFWGGAIFAFCYSMVRFLFFIFVS